MKLIIVLNNTYCNINTCTNNSNGSPYNLFPSQFQITAFSLLVVASKRKKKHFHTIRKNHDKILERLLCCT